MRHAVGIALALAVAALLLALGCRRAQKTVYLDYPVVAAEAESLAPTLAPVTPGESSESEEEEWDIYAGRGDEPLPFSGDDIKGPEATFESVVAKVKPYRVSGSLREVTNLSAFSKGRPISDLEKAKLAKNLFVVTPTDEMQLFHLYEQNDYRNLPSFVTADLALQVHHEVFDYLLRTTEQAKLLPILRDLTAELAETAAERARGIAGAGATPREKAFVRNAAYFAAAALLLKQTPPELSAEARALADKEVALISAHQRRDGSPILGRAVDYSLFTPRGHYTRNAKLERFFRTMSWYGVAPFATRDPEAKVDELAIIQALEIADLFRRPGVREKWESVYEPTSFFVGISDDLTPIEWDAARRELWGETEPELGSEALRSFAEAVEKRRPSRIDANAPDRACQMRVMGQRYIPDSEVLSRLSSDTRPFPCGLDVMAVLGCERATEILDAHPGQYNRENWADYEPRRETLTKEFASLPDAVWQGDLYHRWLRALDAVLTPAPEGYPSLMRSEAWRDKSLETALASWAELRHDTILYAKGSTAECGDDPPPLLHGYVEPNVVLYDRLLRATAAAYRGLEARGLLVDRTVSRVRMTEDLLLFLRTVSEKELRNEPLTDREYEQIRYLGAEVERLTLSIFAPTVSSWALVSEADRDMAVVADVHTVLGTVLEEAVGHPNEILTIVPVDGKLVLARGACFSYYEFHEGKRMTDAEWRERLKSGDPPQQPEWTGSFLVPKEKSGMYGKDPSTLAVYNSGC